MFLSKCLISFYLIYYFDFFNTLTLKDLPSIFLQLCIIMQEGVPGIIMHNFRVPSDKVSEPLPKIHYFNAYSVFHFR